MPLIQCPDCAKDISDAASACVYCGRPNDHAKPEATPASPSPLPKTEWPRISLGHAAKAATPAPVGFERRAKLPSPIWSYALFVIVALGFAVAGYRIWQGKSVIAMGSGQDLATQIALFAIYAAFAGVIYLLPIVVAVRRSHRNVGGILIVTLAFGWTLIGWVVALVWASWRSRDDDAASLKLRRHRGL